MILKLINKDKSFVKWLAKNRQEIANNYFYIPTIVNAFKTGKALKTIQNFEENKKLINKDLSLKPIKELFKDKNFEQLLNYFQAQKTNPRLYLDYINACNFLNISLDIDYNLFPNNFKRMHDIVTLQYQSAKQALDKVELEKLNHQFLAISNKYNSLEKHNIYYSIIIPKSLEDLKFEGKALNHCVGRINYDKKFINEETLIFFVRHSQAKEIPFVTLEVSLKTKMLLQCYGNNNTKPDDSVLEFVNKVWLPFAKRKINKIIA